MKKLIILFLFIGIALSGCGSNNKIQWIKTGDTFIFNNIEYTFKTSYNAQEGDKSRYFLDIHPSNEENSDNAPGTSGPLPKKAFLVDIKGEEIYSAETWGENGELIIQTTSTSFAKGVAYLDDDENLHYFQFP